MVLKSDRSASRLEAISRLNNSASLYAAVLFLFYLLIYSIACPKKELLIAAGCELLFFVCLAAWRFMRGKALDTRAKNVVVDQLTEDIRPLAAARSVYQYLFLAGWLIVCILGTLDFAALGLAFAGNLKASEYLYVNVPTMRLIGAHAGATAEILSGAYVSAGKYEPAEKIYGLVGDVRNSVYGPESESSVGLLADYGDLYASQKQYERAIPFYEKSIEMSKNIHGATGYGRPLTGLANCFREKGESGKAELLYQEALRMRTRLFGPRSEKVAATLKDYAALLQQMGRRKEAVILLERASGIDLVQKKDDNNPLPMMCLMTIVFVASFLLFGRKGVFTKLATRRLQSRVAGASAPNPVDVKRLEVLHKYQGIKSATPTAEKIVR